MPKRMEIAEGRAFRQQPPEERCVASFDVGPGAFRSGVSRNISQLGDKVLNTTLRATNSYRLRGLSAEKERTSRHSAPHAGRTPLQHFGNQSRPPSIQSRTNELESSRMTTVAVRRTAQLAEQLPEHDHLLNKSELPRSFHPLIYKPEQKSRCIWNSARLGTNLRNSMKLRLSTKNKIRD